MDCWPGTFISGSGGPVTCCCGGGADELDGLPLGNDPILDKSFPLPLPPVGEGIALEVGDAAGGAVTAGTVLGADGVMREKSLPFLLPGDGDSAGGAAVAGGAGGAVPSGAGVVAAEVAMREKSLPLGGMG